MSEKWNNILITGGAVRKFSDFSVPSTARGHLRAKCNLVSNHTIIITNSNNFSNVCLVVNDVVEALIF